MFGRSLFSGCNAHSFIVGGSEIAFLDRLALCSLHSCIAGEAFRCLKSSSRIPIKTRNVEVFWVDLDGKEKGYGAIANRATWTQQTSAGSVWRFRQNGQLVGEYTVPNLNPASQSKPVPPQYTIRTAAPAGKLQLGPVGGDGGTPFSFLATSLDYIRIGVSGSIDSISFLVPMADLEKNFGSIKDTKFQEFDMLGEEITGIGVSSGKLVDRIKFYTNKRESPWFGGTGGGPEQILKIPPGGRFSGFVGRAGDSLDAIGLLYTPPPPASGK
jgi:Jacalin-like lectin domain